MKLDVEKLKKLDWKVGNTLETYITEWNGYSIEITSDKYRGKDRKKHTRITIKARSLETQNIEAYGDNFYEYHKLYIYIQKYVEKNDPKNKPKNEFENEFYVCEE